MVSDPQPLLEVFHGMDKEASRNVKIADAFSSHGTLLALAYEIWGEDSAHAVSSSPRCAAMQVMVMIMMMVMISGDDDDGDDYW